MIKINIISPTPGISTREHILEIVQARETGTTVKEIKQIINRPISMIQIHLKELIAAKAIFTRKNKAGVGLIYYPSKAPINKGASPQL